MPGFVNLEKMMCLHISVFVCTRVGVCIWLRTIAAAPRTAPSVTAAALVSTMVRSLLLKDTAPGPLWGLISAVRGMQSLKSIPTSKEYPQLSLTLMPPAYFTDAGILPDVSPFKETVTSFLTTFPLKGIQERLMTVSLLGLKYINYCM